MTIALIDPSPFPKQPSWEPPKWVFPVAWTLLYSAMGYASLRAYRAGASQLGMGLYTAQLLANFAWTPIFFEHHNISLAAKDMTGAWGLWGLTI